MAQQTYLGQLTNNEQRIAAAFINKLRAKFDRQLVSVILFGSRARGEADSGSDMDLLVVMTDVNFETRQAVRYLAVEVWLDYGVYLSTRVWDQDHWRKLAALQTSLYQNICRDGIDLLELATSTA
ncbi:MAG: nucleotidyltransferase domain-containing protein [Chloroflexota bacterium]